MIKKKLSTQEFRDTLADHYERQPGLLRGEEARKKADGMAQHYSKGESLLADAAATLRDIADSHPDPEKRKAADMAIKKMDDAVNSFCVASTCHSSSWNVDEA